MMKPDDEKTYLVNALDDISELIYVSDIETHDVLYVNETGLKEFQLEHIEKGEKCYKLFQGMDAPCPFCTTPRLKEGENYTWERYNPVTGRYYMLKDRLISWDGRMARMEIAFDMTKSQEEKVALRYSLDMEKLLLECIKILAQEKDITESLNKVVRMVGEYLSAERSYIFEFRNQKMDNTYEWCRDGVPPQKMHLQGLDGSLIDPWREAFAKQQCVVIENVQDIEDEALRNVLVPQGIKGLVIVPLQLKGKIIGYFGVDNPPMEKVRNIISLLDALQYFIMVTFQQKKDEELLEHMSYHDSLTGLYNRNKYIMDVKTFKKRKTPLGVIYLDVNSLKEINDQHGHAYGDYILVKCTEKMQKIIGDACIYRTGGDEFIAIFGAEREKQLHEMEAQLKKEFLDSDLCTVAVGSQWVPDPEQLETFIEVADNLMYMDKKRYYEESNIQEAKRYRSPRVSGHCE